METVFVVAAVVGLLLWGRFLKRHALSEQQRLRQQGYDLTEVRRVEQKNASLSAKTGAGRQEASGMETADLRIPEPYVDPRKFNHVSDRESAIRLVRGIALHNDIVLLTKEGLAEEDEEAPSRLIHDILTALCPKIKVVDVSSDDDMHMGLPQENGKPILPCLYIGGKLIGNQSAVLTALDDGTLPEELKRAKVDIDETVMESLRNQNGI